MELQVTEYSVCGSGTSSNRKCCVWNMSGSLCKARLTRERRGHRPLGHNPLGGSVIDRSILAVALTGICVCFLCYYQAVTNQLTYDKDPDTGQTSCPKAAGTKLPTDNAPIRRRVLNPVRGS